MMKVVPKDVAMIFKYVKRFARSACHIDCS